MGGGGGGCGGGWGGNSFGGGSFQWTLNQRSNCVVEEHHSEGEGGEGVSEWLAG